MVRRLAQIECRMNGWLNREIFSISLKRSYYTIYKSMQLVGSEIIAQVTNPFDQHSLAAKFLYRNDIHHSWNTMTVNEIITQLTNSFNRHSIGAKHSRVIAINRTCYFLIKNELIIQFTNPFNRLSSGATNSYRNYIYMKFYEWKWTYYAIYKSVQHAIVWRQTFIP